MKGRGEVWKLWLIWGGEQKGLTYRHRQHSQPPTFSHHNPSGKQNIVFYSNSSTIPTTSFVSPTHLIFEPQGLVVSLWEDTAQSICSTKPPAVPSREKCGTVPLPEGCQLALLGAFQLHCNPYFSTNYSPSTCRHTHTHRAMSFYIGVNYLNQDWHLNNITQKDNSGHYTEQELQYFKTEVRGKQFI